jgi:hypothetical protein
VSSQQEKSLSRDTVVVNHYNNTADHEEANNNVVAIHMVVEDVVPVRAAPIIKIINQKAKFAKRSKIMFTQLDHQQNKQVNTASSLNI